MRIPSILTIALGCLALVACDPASKNEGEENEAGVLAPRTDGIYMSQFGNIVQMLHFYPQGNVVTLNCTDVLVDSMKATFRPDKAADLMKGVHNVPFAAHHDSVLFRTTVMQGFVNYRGRLFPGDSITMTKNSTVNGASMKLTYRFIPDGSAQ